MLVLRNPLEMPGDEGLVLPSGLNGTPPFPQDRVGY